MTKEDFVALITEEGGTRRYAEVLWEHEAEVLQRDNDPARVRGAMRKVMQEIKAMGITEIARRLDIIP